MGKKLSLEEMRQLFIDLIYDSDDARTCDGDYFCDINETPETKCRTCAAWLVAEYEKKVKAEALDEMIIHLRDCEKEALDNGAGTIGSVLMAIRIKAEQLKEQK